MSEPPVEIGRSEFDEWCWRRGLGLRDVVEGLRAAAIALGRPTQRIPSIETVRLIRLPFSDPARRVPGRDVVELIHAFTGGAIVAGHFYPPHLRGQPVTPPRVPEGATP
jgi:hypothetical protein